MIQLPFVVSHSLGTVFVLRHQGTGVGSHRKYLYLIMGDGHGVCGITIYASKQVVLDSHF